MELDLILLFIQETAVSITLEIQSDLTDLYLPSVKEFFNLTLDQTLLQYYLNYLFALFYCFIMLLYVYDNDNRNNKCSFLKILMVIIVLYF